MFPYIARIFTSLNILIFCNDCKFKNFFINYNNLIL